MYSRLNALCPVIKRLIVYHIKELHSSPQTIFSVLFESDPKRISIKWLKNLCSKIRNESNDALEDLVNLRPYHPGRPRSLNNFEMNVNLYLMISDCNKRLMTLTKEFAEIFHGCDAEELAPSLNSVRRTLIRAGLTRKALTRLNANINEELREELYDRIAYVDPHFFVDIDI